MSCSGRIPVRSKFGAGIRRRSHRQERGFLGLFLLGRSPRSLRGEVYCPVIRSCRLRWYGAGPPNGELRGVNAFLARGTRCLGYGTFGGEPVDDRGRVGFSSGGGGRKVGGGAANACAAAAAAAAAAAFLLL
jgi:hypothetical protein